MKKSRRLSDYARQEIKTTVKEISEIIISFLFLIFGAIGCFGIFSILFGNGFQQEKEVVIWLVYIGWFSLVLLFCILTYKMYKYIKDNMIDCEE